jgi:hypothetical protein
MIHVEPLNLNDPECRKARAEHYDEYIKHLKDPNEGLTLRNTMTSTSST